MRKILRVLSLIFPFAMVLGETDAWKRIKEGLATNKEDLQVNWEEFNKYDKK